MLASELLTQVRRLGALPTSTNAGLADADILASADMELQGTFLPALRRLNEEYLVRVATVASVGGRVTLPSRAAGAAVRLVQLAASGGGYVNLPRLAPEDATGLGASGVPVGFYFDGGGIVLLPSGTSGTVRVHYHARPGRMAVPTGGVISTITADAPTAGRTQFVFSTVTLTGALDIVSSGPAHEAVGLDLTAANLTTTGCDVATSSLLGAVQVGDYICTRDTSPFVPLPEEMAPALVSLVVARMLRQGGYQSESAQHLAEGKEGLERINDLLRPRSDGNPKRLRGGILSRMRGGW